MDGVYQCGTDMVNWVLWGPPLPPDHVFVQVRVWAQIESGLDVEDAADALLLDGLLGSHALNDLT